MIYTHQRILSRLPASLRSLILKASGFLGYFRVQAPVTSLLGPQYRRSRVFVEIDLTWSCNLRCYNCNRSCEQAPTSERMDAKQIKRFVKESIATNQQWELIRVLGGEPTLHPEFFTIIDTLLDWQRSHSPNTKIELVTNGFGQKVQKAIKRLPPEIIVDNTFKDSRVQPFMTFNVAPDDCPEYSNANYTNGCLVTKWAGIGLTPYGWYPCAVAGGIDRIIGLDIGRKSMPTSEDDMFDQMNVFCRLCGLFKRRYEKSPDGPVMSKSWKEAYKQHREAPSKLTRY
ncbi:MAG: radical SAM protein [Candidatus Thiodiazotropha sp.]|jgi:hypothetical protein